MPIRRSLARAGLRKKLVLDKGSPPSLEKTIGLRIYYSGAAERFPQDLRDQPLHSTPADWTLRATLTGVPPYGRAALPLFSRIDPQGPARCKQSHHGRTRTRAVTAR